MPTPEKPPSCRGHATRLHRRYASRLVRHQEEVLGTLLGGTLLALIFASPLVAGQIEIRVADEATGEPIAVNMFLKDAYGRTRKPPKVPFWKDHFSFDGSVILKLPSGRYTFEIERGPEYQIRYGHFQISRESDGLENVTLRRFVDMQAEGWWSGDLHVHRAPTDVPLLMRAQDLHVAPIITWWNEQNLWQNQPLPEEVLLQQDGDYFVHLLAGEDERGGGALLYFNLDEPLELPSRSQREYPPMSRFLELASRRPGAHVDVEKPFWWDVPVWLASGQVDSIGLANNHMLRDGMLDNEAWGKPRDSTFYPSPRGNGFWSQDIYYHMLNCGLRLPPSAGSASGVLQNPIGYNRVYVHCPDGLSWEAWWEGLRAGRVVVTNGPLLRPLVNGQYPGHVFTANQGETVSLVVNLKLSIRDKINYLEVVQNGEVVHEVRLEEYRQRRGSLPPVEFQESGWMLVRAVVADEKKFRFASTGPYYVEIGQQPRISRESAQFFVDWVDQRIDQLKSSDVEHRDELLRDQEVARAYWQAKLNEATTD
jgi:hypothetical protein